MQRVYQLNRCILLSVYSRRCLDVNSHQVLNSARSWCIEDRHGVDSKNGRHYKNIATRNSLCHRSLWYFWHSELTLRIGATNIQKSQPTTLGKIYKLVKDCKCFLLSKNSHPTIHDNCQLFGIKGAYQESLSNHNLRKLCMNGTVT